MYRATEESPRMFASDLVDFFSRVPWFVVPIIYVPAIAGWIGWGMWVAGASPAAIALQVAIGWFIWTLLEYWLHRTLFHWTPPTSWGPRFHFILHGVHHDWYKDRLRLVMPPAASLAIGVVVWSATLLAGRLLSFALDPSWTYGVFAGIMCGYLAYDMIHYYVHHGRPRSAVMKALRSHHAKHHHNPRYADKKFGVSTTLWDHVFGTYA